MPAGTYYYVCTALNEFGESDPTVEGSITTDGTESMPLPSIFGLELKSLRGRLDEHQILAHARLGECGMDVVTVKSVDDVQAALARWEIPNRAPVIGWTKEEIRENDKLVRAQVAA